MLLPSFERHRPSPRDVVAGLEARPRLDPGPGERFTGYAVFGVAFESGDLLAVRRFAATSIGPAYSSVWHRSPRGRWTVYQDLQADAGCGRYYSAAADVVTAAIRIVWSGAERFGVIVDADTTLALRVSLAPAGMNRAITRLAMARLPLTGVTPNGFVVDMRPCALWRVAEAEASLDHRSLGTPRLSRGTRMRIGAIEIPRRALFATRHAALLPATASPAATRRGGPGRVPSPGGRLP